MTKYTIPFIVALILPFTTVVAQKNQPKTKTTKTAAVATTKTEKGALFFEKTQVNLGTIEDTETPIKIDFKYKNIGKGAVTIKSILPDCDCSKASSNKTKVEFDQSGEITVYFFPKTQSGKVTKTITVITDGEPEVTYLTLVGNINDKYAKLERLYPEKQGNIMFSSYQVKFPFIYNYGIDSAVRIMHNPTSKPIKITHIKAPSYIDVSKDYDIIAPNGGIALKFKYFAFKTKDIGPKLDEVLVATDDSIEPLKKFLVRVNIVEDFTLLTKKEKDNPPIFEAVTPVVNIDTMNIKSSATATFYITNKGKTPMYIRKVYSTCGCTKFEYDTQTPIKRGKKAAIKVTYDSNYDLGKVEKLIYVITNTPDLAIHELMLKANVMYLRKP